MYLLTPRGVEEKVKVTKDFLKRKMIEYEQIKKEIEFLQQEVSKRPNQNTLVSNFTRSAED